MCRTHICEASLAIYQIFAVEEQCLEEDFHHPDLSLDFFIKVSSSKEIINALGRKPWASVDAFRKTPMAKEKSNLVHLTVGTSDEFSLVTESQVFEQSSGRQGLTIISREELFILLDYAIITNARGTDADCVLTGFDWRTLRDDGHVTVLENPIFNYLPRSPALAKRQNTSKVLAIAQKSLADADDEDEAHQIVKIALQQKISSVAFEYDITDLHTPIADFGLDSLVMFRLRTWISQKFQATLDSYEISNAANIVSLAQLILERTPLTTHHRLQAEKHTSGHYAQQRDQTAPHDRIKMSHQPLPLLEESLRLYLDSARPFCSDDEFAATRRSVEAFRKQDGMGQQLHLRLVERANDPKIEIGLLTCTWSVDTFESENL